MIELWYFNGSTGADYGTFTCSRCGKTFCYSPRDIVENGEVIADGWDSQRGSLPIHILRAIDEVKSTTQTIRKKI